MGRSNGGSKQRATTVALAFCTVLTMMLPEVYGRRFIVGGNMGWTSNVNYTLWAGNQTFYLGDWLFFVYDRHIDDVIEVNKTNYETCNANHPIHNYTMGAGRDVVPLNVTHDRYFISSKQYCHGGMKLHVHLTPLPSPIHLAPSLSPVVLAPSPSPIRVNPLPSAIHLAPSSSPIHLSPLPQPPRAAPSRSYSSRSSLLISQLAIPFVVTIFVPIWDLVFLV